MVFFRVRQRRGTGESGGLRHQDILGEHQEHVRNQTTPAAPGASCGGEVLYDTHGRTFYLTLP